MFMNLGDVPAGSTLYCPFATYNSSGASVTITGLAVTDIEIYKDGGTTQRASDNGYTLLDTDGIDFDGITGIHGFSVDLSDNTTAGFYAAGSTYWIVVSAITVDSQTVNFGYYFTIDKANVLRPTTAGRTLDVTAAGEAGLDFANVALPDGPIPALAILEGGTAQSATSTTLVGRAAATDGIVRPGHILWAFGSTQGYWQSVMIDSVSADTFTIAAWPVTTPTGTITYRVWGSPQVSTSLPIPADLRQIGGDAQSATDLKDFADAGYDPATNKVEGVKLADSLTAVAAGGITASSLAADTITAAKVAADVTTEIQSGLATAANLATVAGYIDTEVAAILALLDDPRTEPGQGSPPVNPDLATKIDYLYKAWRNRSTQTASEYALYADDGTTKDHEAACSDDGSVFVRGEVVSGA